MNEEISREEIAALLARESMNEKITRKRAIGVITLHREHWQRLMKGNVCSKQEGEESIAAFDVALAALSAEPCKDTISRQAVLALPRNKVRDLKTMEVVCETINVIDIETLPIVTPKPRTGHWIRWYEQKETEWGIENTPHCKCSECGTEYDPHSSQFIKYCNECGAKMQEVEE